MIVLENGNPSSCYSSCKTYSLMRTNIPSRGTWIDMGNGTIKSTSGS